MMRKTIVRTMATSEIKAFKLTMKDGQPSVVNLDPITVTGEVSEKDALKALKEVHGNLTGITVGEITVTKDTYEISVEDFLKYAKKVTKDSEPSEN